MKKIKQDVFDVTNQKFLCMRKKKKVEVEDITKTPFRIFISSEKII